MRHNSHKVIGLDVKNHKENKSLDFYDCHMSLGKVFLFGFDEMTSYNFINVDFSTFVDDKN